MNFWRSLKFASPLCSSHLSLGVPDNLKLFPHQTQSIPPQKFPKPLIHEYWVDWAFNYPKWQHSYLKKIVYLFIVDLQEGAENVGIAHRLKFIENLVDCTRNYACISTSALEIFRLDDFLTLALGAKHGKGFSWASLSICENSNIIAIQDPGYDRDESIIYVILRSVWVECLVEGDF